MVPQRMCAVCRERREKGDLMRVVKTPDGEIRIDNTGKIQGRGMYICKCGVCRVNAAKRRVLERTFSCSVEKDIYEMIAKG